MNYISGFKRIRTIAAASLVTGLLASSSFSLPAFADGSVEVMHFWTTGGEAAALKAVKDKVEAAGV